MGTEDWIYILSRNRAETKTGHNRKVPIHPSLHAILAAHALRASGWFFVAPPSKKYPDGNHHSNTKRLNEDFLQLLQKLQMPVGRFGGFTIHSLRHSFEIICVNAGIPQRVIDTWLGHSSDRSMASVYYKLSDADSQLFMQKVPFLDLAGPPTPLKQFWSRALLELTHGQEDRQLVSADPGYRRWRTTGQP